MKNRYKTGKRVHASNFTEKKDEFEIPAELSLADENYGMAVRLGDKKFLDFANGVLAELKNNGEAEKIFAKWLKGAPGAPAVEASSYADYTARTGQAHQRKKQEAYDKSKQRYDYEYDDGWGWRHVGWSGGWGGGWGGYYHW